MMKRLIRNRNDLEKLKMDKEDVDFFSKMFQKIDSTTMDWFMTDDFRTTGRVFYLAFFRYGLEKEENQLFRKRLEKYKACKRDILAGMLWICQANNNE